jgi:hypothetical protein
MLRTASPANTFQDRLRLNARDVLLISVPRWLLPGLRLLMIESTGAARAVAAPQEHFLEVGLAEPLVAVGLRMKEAAANPITYRVTAWLMPIDVQATQPTTGSSSIIYYSPWNSDRREFGSLFWGR